MKNSSKTIILLLFGIAAGASLSLLLTSEKSEKTCRKIAGSMRDFCRSAKKNCKPVIERVKEECIED